MRDSKSSNFSEAEDIEIVAVVLTGNTAAFSTLVQHHHERVYNTVYGLISCDCSLAQLLGWHC